jgi:hypothetical protein
MSEESWYFARRDANSKRKEEEDLFSICSIAFLAAGSSVNSSGWKDGKLSARY